MHGPNHLFCAGCNMEDDALAAASWAGYLSAHGKHAEAATWADTARKRQGRLMLQWSTQKGAIVIRISGDDRPSNEDLEAVIKCLTLQLDAEAALAAPATLPHDGAPAGTAQGSDAGTRERAGEAEQP